MRRVLLAAIVLGLVLFGAGCSQSDSGGQGLAFGSAPWKAGDRVTYDWVDKNGNKVGSSEFGFAKDGEAWVVAATDKFATLDQSSRVRVDGQSLKPLAIDKTIKAQGTDAVINGTYKENKLEIKATVNGENKSASTDVPANALDNDQLIATVRALKFADGYEGKCTVVTSQNAAKIATTVRVQGKAKVDVPAGSFETWKVEFDFGQAKQYGWYQVEAPHNLVQYDNGNLKLALTK